MNVTAGYCGRSRASAALDDLGDAASIEPDRPSATRQNRCNCTRDFGRRCRHPARPGAAWKSDISHRPRRQALRQQRLPRASPPDSRWYSMRASISVFGSIRAIGDRRQSRSAALRFANGSRRRPARPSAAPLPATAARTSGSSRRGSGRRLLVVDAVVVAQGGGRMLHRTGFRRRPINRQEGSRYSRPVGEPFRCTRAARDRTGTSSAARHRGATPRVVGRLATAQRTPGNYRPARAAKIASVVAARDLPGGGRMDRSSSAPSGIGASSAARRAVPSRMSAHVHDRHRGPRTFLAFAQRARPGRSRPRRSRPGRREAGRTRCRGWRSSCRSCRRGRLQTECQRAVRCHA